MKKIVALMALVAFTFAVQADCGKCAADKQGTDKSKTEGCCHGKCSKSGKCHSGGDKAPDAAKPDAKKG